MNMWNKEDFDFSGGYLTYRYDHTKHPAFVARFKYGGMGRFKSFLVKNFYPDEYFAMLRMGLAPYEILESRGWTR